MFKINNGIDNSAFMTDEHRRQNNSFFDASPLTGWVRCVANEDLTIHYINDYFITLLGYESFDDLMNACSGSYKKLMAKGKNVDDIIASSINMRENDNMVFTYSMLTKAGQEIHIREHCRKYLDENGTQMLLSLCIDISDVVKMENDLRLSEETYRIAVAHGGNLICRYAVNERVITYSAEAAQLFALPERIENVPEGLISNDFIAQESSEDYLLLFDAIKRGEKSGSTVIRRKINDGSLRWFSVSFTNIFETNGKPASAIISFNDITEEREEDIVSALDKQRLIVALKSEFPVSLSINLTKGTYKVLSGGEAVKKMDPTEGTLTELAERGIQRMDEGFIDEFSKKFNAQAMLNSFKAGRESFRMTYRQQAHDGKVHWIEATVFKIDNAYGDDLMGIMLFRFVDEQKAAEEKLKQALEITSGELAREKRYQQIVDTNIPVGTLIFRAKDGALLHTGGTMLRDLGYSVDEFRKIQQNHLHGFVHDDDYENNFHDIRRKNGKLLPYFEQEYRVRKKDGSIVWVFEKGTLTMLNDGPAYVVVCMDVTGRKKMEDNLRISEQEMSLAMARMGKTVCLFDIATHTLTIPQSYADLYDLETTVPNLLYNVEQSNILSDISRQEYIRFYKAIVNGSKSESAECCLRHADGTWHWEHFEAITISDSDGKAVKAIITVEDTTLRHQNEDEAQALRENERLLRMVAQHSNRIICRYDIESCTATFESAGNFKELLCGVLPESAIEANIVLPESIDDFKQIFDDIRTGKPNGSAKVHIYNSQGEARWLDMRYSVIDPENAKREAAVISFADITADHEKELAYSRYRQSISDENTSGGKIYFETDLTADIVERQGGTVSGVQFPEAGCTHIQAVNYGVDSLVGKNEQAKVRAFFAREHLFTCFADGIRNLTNDVPVKLPGKNDAWFRVEIQMVRDPYSGHVKAYIIMYDITEEKLATLAVQKMAEIDGNTNLYNKKTTEKLIRERLSQENLPGALLLADLDDLKKINDSYGHAQGDRALSLIARTLREQFRSSDIVGRVGGDEFMVFIGNVENDVKLSGNMTALMQKLSALRIGEKGERALHASIGVAFTNGKNDTFEDLYRFADRALYHVKRNGKNDYAFYTPEMEHSEYEFKGHNASMLWQAVNFDRSELSHLLYAVSTVYPLVISVNLTQNSYYMMEYDNYTTTSHFNSGVFDDLIENGAKTFHPDDRAAFKNSFNRLNLLSAYERGEKSVSYTGRQMGDDGIYRTIRTDVIFITDRNSSDVLQITLSREVTD